MKDFVTSFQSVELLRDPVGAAFQSGWRQWAQTHGAVQSLPEFMGHFASLSDHAPDAGKDLAEVIAVRKAPVLFLQQDDIHVPPEVCCLQRSSGVQMVLHAPQSPVKFAGICQLGPRDAEAMLRLARVCKPGPFEIGTHLLGKFIGLREGGRLIAMAGQRMRLPGWIEISAVSVHPDYQRRGLGARVIRAMVDLICREGDTPFLHTYAHNKGAISLYQSLGFEFRAEMHIAPVGPVEQSRAV
ncbi:MAG: GNAT family N-acetyltransferase [Pseudomonadota bacterium]